MIKKILLAACIAAAGTGICVAQPENSQIFTNWGANVAGAQLSVVLTNNIISCNSTTTLLAAVKNVSTNDITLADDFTVSLVNAAGKEIIIKRPPLLHLERIIKNVKSLEIYSWATPIKIPKGIDSGIYSLKATRKFSTKGKFYQLTSNFPKIQIK